VCVATYDKAWETLAATFPDGVTLETYLLPQNLEMLEDILKYHIINGSYPVASLDSGNLTTLNGQDLSVDVSGTTISFNGVYITEPDWLFNNGVVHIIDILLIPPDRANDYVPEP
jgi:uncharacterized surface protein with fasciclin (FAS1) repeats